MVAEMDNARQRLPSHEEIAKRAYEIFLARGGAPGHDMDDWLQAQYELMKLPVREIAKLEPPQESKHRGAKKSLISLVRAAMYLC